MKILCSGAIVSMFLVIGCSEKKPVDRMTDQQLHEYANELAHKFIITDGHVDLPFRLKESNYTSDSIAILVSTKKGDFDFERAKKRRS